MIRTAPTTRALAAPLLLALAALALPGCGDDETSSADPNTVVIGCKKFTEQMILGELLAQLIEHRTDLNVKRVFNLGGTMICHNALTAGDIDAYVEYTGTALTAILNRDVIADPGDAYADVAQAYDDEFGLVWLDPIGFDNTYALVVRGSDANEKGWATISDMADAAPQMTAGFTHEFMGRPDGYPGLEKTYGLELDSIKRLAPALMYQAVASGQVDVISGYATDGRIRAYELTPLEDDRGFFPPYEAAPVVRADTLAEHPELREALNALAGKIDDQTMQRLNFAVDEKQESPQAVAAEFLKEAGLVE